MAGNVVGEGRELLFFSSSAFCVSLCLCARSFFSSSSQNCTSQGGNITLAGREKFPVHLSDFWPSSGLKVKESLGKLCDCDQLGSSS